MTERRKNRQRRWLFCCLTVLSLFALWFSLPVADYGDVGRLRRAVEKDGHIIHAGGFLSTENGEQVSYTNSLEALENLYAHGNRFCEIDLQETSDGMLVCGHGDEKELAFGTGLPTTAGGRDFLESRIYGCFTPISFADLADFLRVHHDLYVITDVKTDNLRVCRRIAEDARDLRDRIIVQIHLPEEYEEIRNLGFPYILYPIFETPDDQRGVLQLAAFARTHPLVALILPNGYYSPDIKLFLAQKLIGVPVVLHTLNDDWEMSYYLDHHLALAVYTDRTEF